MDAVDLHAAHWQRLLANRNRMPHALMLCGPEGNGKTAFAHALAASLLCESPLANGRACAGCLACNWFAQGNHPDFRWLRPEADAVVAGSEAGKDAKEGKDKASREITIDQVRLLSDFLNLATHRAGWRVVLVTPAEAMNRNTANALLKSLEEPKPGTVFVLVSDHPDRLLPTIRSRCRVEVVPIPDPASACRFLDARGIAEPQRWLALAGGAPLLAIEVAAGSQRKLVDLLDAYFQRGAGVDPLALAAAAETLLKAERSLDAYRLVDWTQRWAHDLALAVSGLSPRYYRHAEASLQRVSTQTSFVAVTTFCRRAVEFKRLARHPLNLRLFLEDFFFEYATLFSPRSL